MAGLSVPEDDSTEAKLDRGRTGGLIALVVLALLLPSSVHAQVLGPGADPQPQERDRSDVSSDESLPKEVEYREDQEVPEGEPAGPGDVVDEVQVVGNRRVEEASVLERIGTKSGQAIRREQISKDIHDVHAPG